MVSVIIIGAIVPSLQLNAWAVAGIAVFLYGITFGWFIWKCEKKASENRKYANAQIAENKE